MGGFRAMGTEITVLAPAASSIEEAALTRAIASIFAELEGTFSRFRRTSLLSRLNRANGPFPLPPEVLALLDRARAYFERTGGLFNPAVGASLRDAGYDRSFSPGALDRPTTPGAASGSVVSLAEALRIDHERGTATVRGGVEIDLGGIVKGLAVDRAAALLPANGAVDAGGDVYLKGDAEPGAGWLVDVEDPFDASRVAMTLRVRDAGVATSAPNRRNWRCAGHTMHHLIDPRTGAPARSDLAQMTVVARTAELADVLAKAAFVAGSDRATSLLADGGARGGVMIHRSGVVETIGDVEVVDEPAPLG